MEVERARPLLDACGIRSLDGLLELGAACRGQRAGLGLPMGRWDLRCLLAALQTAVQRGRQPTRAPAALLQLAGDPLTRSPMRLAESGPWWAVSPPRLSTTSQELGELRELESCLIEYADRDQLKAQAAAELVAAGEPADRLAISRRALRLAELRTPSLPASAIPVFEALPESLREIFARRRPHAAGHKGHAA